MTAEFQYSPPTDPWLTIIHEDRDLLVVDKPSGLLSVPGRIHNDSALSRALEKVPRAYACHRLDMDTSGLMIIALRRSAEREIKRQFRERLIRKTYIAVVWGQLPDDQGQIEAPLSRVAGPLPRSVVDHDNGRSAFTRYEVIARQADRTVLKLTPQTGRSHQLRVHMAELGHPIIGDRFYGDDSSPQDRLHLHAASLQFAHPYTGEPVVLNSKAPFAG